MYSYTQSQAVSSHNYNGTQYYSTPWPDQYPVSYTQVPDYSSQINQTVYYDVSNLQKEKQRLIYETNICKKQLIDAREEQRLVNNKVFEEKKQLTNLDKKIKDKKKEADLEIENLKKQKNDIEATIQEKTAVLIAEQELLFQQKNSLKQEKEKLSTFAKCFSKQIDAFAKLKGLSETSFLTLLNAVRCD